MKSEKNNSSYFTAVWKDLLDAARPHRRAGVLLIVAIVLLIAAINGFDHAGLETTRDAMWQLLFLIFPVTTLFSRDVNVVFTFLSSVKAGIFFPKATSTNPNLVIPALHPSVIHAVPLSPPRFRLA